jgi:hypothetical protein
VGYEGQFVSSEFATDFSKEIEKYLKNETSSDLSLRIHFVVILRFPL